MANRLLEKQCACCDRVKAMSGFRKSLNPRHKSGLLPYCKTCCTSLLKEYINKTGNDAAGLWCFCAELGIPFLMEYWLKTKEIVYSNTGAGAKPNILNTYLDLLEENKVNLIGFWESDKMLTDFIEVGINFEDKTDKEVQLDLKEQEKIWGRLPYTDQTEIEEAYEFLNNTFDNYTQDILEMDGNLINRYRDLCRCELTLRKANEQGDISGIKSAQDILNKQLSLLKLNDFKADTKSDTDRFIDRLIWKIEETEPCEEEDLKKYRDIAGFEKSFSDIMRSMRNLLVGTRDYPNVPREEQ